MGDDLAGVDILHSGGRPCSLLLCACLSEGVGLGVCRRVCSALCGVDAAKRLAFCRNDIVLVPRHSQGPGAPCGDGPAVGLLAPLLWLLTDKAFSGDPFWSFRVVQANWEGTFRGLTPCAGASKCLESYWLWLDGAFGYPVLLICIPGLILLARRGPFMRLLLLVSATELVGYLVGGATKVAGFADRFVPMVNLSLLLGIGAVGASLCEAIARRRRLLGLAFALPLLAAGAGLLWGEARSVARTCTRMHATEQHYRDAVAEIKESIGDGDMIVLEMRHIPTAVARTDLYPMIRHFRGAILYSESHLDRAIAGHPSCWIIAGPEWIESPVFQRWVSRHASGAGGLDLVAHRKGEWSIFRLRRTEA